MPKAPLIEEDAILESQIINTLIAGHKVYRPDLDYPQSHSDMQGAARGLMRMFNIQRRSLPEPLRFKCDDCEGIGKYIKRDAPGVSECHTCSACKGKGWVPG